jgi:hypothetical protein
MKMLSDPDSLTQYQSQRNSIAENALASPDGENDVVQEDGDGVGDGVARWRPRHQKMSVTDTDLDEADAAPAPSHDREDG